MNNPTKVRPSAYVPTITALALVRDGQSYDATGRVPRVSPADARSNQLAREAHDWLRFAQERSRMRPESLTAKAFDALAFSVQHGAKSLTVPTKLSGTKGHQPAAWRLLRERARLGHALVAREVHGGPIGVYHHDERLGEVQGKHSSWLRPLLAFGARPYLLTVSGSEREGYTLGVNVALGHIGSALAALRHALGEVSVERPGGDGHAGDGYSGDGLATPEPATLTPPCDPADVVLWRDERGVAQASIPHAVRHSPTGVEWGYDRSGPADLARSVLCYFADDEAAVEALYARYMAEVVAHMPRKGGLLRAADVRAWLDRRAAESGA